MEMDKIKTATINLDNYITNSDYRTQNSLTGRERGKVVSVKANVDNIAQGCDLILITIPCYIYAITPSFFEGLFANAIRRLGKEKFLGKFKLTSDSGCSYEKSLNEAIYRTIRSKETLSK